MVIKAACRRKDFVSTSKNLVSAGRIGTLHVAAFIQIWF